jgi:hypothetical protein
VVKKKSRIKITDGLEIALENTNFSKPFVQWRNKCSGLSGNAIGTDEDKGNLYVQISRHVDTTVRRPNSKNSGNTGAYKLLERIADILKEPKQTEEELGLLNDFVDDLEAMLESKTLNPQNTLFREYESYSGTGENFQPEGEKIEIYGHYRTPQFKAKSGGDFTVESSWYNKKKNTAKPPYYQALFGTGTENLGLVGLQTIMEKAIEDIENNGVDVFVSNISLVNKLVKLDFIATVFKRLLRDPSFYTQEEFLSSKLAQHLKTNPFTVPQKFSKRVAEAFDIVGDVNTIRFELSAKQVKTLLKRMATFNPKFPEPKDYKHPTTNKEVVLKWEEIIRKETSKRAIEQVDNLMSDLKPRSARVIIEELHKVLPKSDMKGTRTMSRLIPTEKELKYYLGRSPRYTSEKRIIRRFPDKSTINERVYQLKGE